MPKLGKIRKVPSTFCDFGRKMKNDLENLMCWMFLIKSLLKIDSFFKFWENNYGICASSPGVYSYPLETSASFLKQFCPISGSPPTPLPDPTGN